MREVFPCNNNLTFYNFFLKGGEAMMYQRIDYDYVSKILLRIRNAKQIPQTALTACSQGMLSKIENGVTSPTFTILSEILYQMEISLAEFETLLHEHEHGEQYLFIKKVEQSIQTYNYATLTKQMKLQREKRNLPELIIFNNWAKFCFSLSFMRNSKTDYRYLSSIINQDEFFIMDFQKLIYGLPMLEFDTALYNYRRILDQLRYHPQAELLAHYIVDAAITIGNICLHHGNRSDAQHYFFCALQQAKKIEDPNRIILANLFLYFMTKEASFLEEITVLKKIFSKDNFYDYWYNVLYNKFNEV